MATDLRGKKMLSEKSISFTIQTKPFQPQFRSEAASVAEAAPKTLISQTAYH
jgi:hypothetical protein